MNQPCRMRSSTKFSRSIHATAPTRICDIGGWTDTRFAGHGAVFNIAVSPCVKVRIDTRKSAAREWVTITAVNYRMTYTIDPESLFFDKHPLLEASVHVMGLPKDIAATITIESDAPPGAGMGTSAAVTVALIGALDKVRSGNLTPLEIAMLAHRIETEELGLECGVQDQLASACGGINSILIDRFPHATVSRIPLPERIRLALEQRLVLVYIGTPHHSSEIHKMVIQRLGQDAEHDPRMQRLRDLAAEAGNALTAGDFRGLGKLMTENTEVQRLLHPALVCPRFEEVLKLVSGFDVLGCKINGAGGDGGSMTLLTDGDALATQRLKETLIRKGFRILPIGLSEQGLCVREYPGGYSSGEEGPSTGPTA